MSPYVAPVLAAAAVMAAGAGVRGGLRTRSRSERAAIAERSAVLRRLGGSLRRAGVSAVGPLGFVALVGGGAVAVAGTVWLVLGSWIAGVLVGGLAIAGAVAFIRSADRRHVERVTAQLPLVAQQISGGLGAGLSLSQAIARAARDLPEPAAGEFERVSRELALGARVEVALDALCRRIPASSMRMMVTAIVIQRSVGGDLARGLADLAGRLDERTRLEREARSVTAQARMSAWLVAGLPLLAGIVVEVAAPGTLQETLGAGPGRALLIAATLMEALGITLVRRMVRMEGVTT